MEILPTLERPGVMRFLPMNPRDTQGRAGTTYLYSWVTLFPRFSFLPLWAQNTMAWMPALRGAWDRHTLKPLTNQTGGRLGPGVGKERLRGYGGGQPEGGRWGRWPVTPASKNLSFQQVGGEAGFLYGSRRAQALGWTHRIRHTAKAIM